MITFNFITLALAIVLVIYFPYWWRTIRKLRNDRDYHRLEYELLDGRYAELQSWHETLNDKYTHALKELSQSRKGYDVLKDKWHELNTKYAYILSEQEDAVVVTDLPTGNHELKQFPFAEKIHQCAECGADMRQTAKMWICDNCGKRERQKEVE